MSSEGRKDAGAGEARRRIAGGIVGRTVPSFRIALAEEEAEWRGYRKRLDKPIRTEFDNMLAIPRLYLSACSGACKLVRLDPVKLSILLQHFIELKAIAEKRDVKVLPLLCL